MDWIQVHTARERWNQLKQEHGFDGVDPHLIWADLSYFKPGNSYSDNPIPVMFEAKQENGAVVLPKTSVTLVEGTKYFCPPFFTGFVALKNLQTFRAEVERFRIGVVALPTTKKARPSIPMPMLPRDMPSDEVVIGIIDHGIAFANENFASKNDAGVWQSRIERVWDQQKGYPSPPLRYHPGNPKKMNWKGLPHYGYGRELRNEAANAQIDYWLGQRISEAEVYRRLCYLPTQGTRAHGTHVMGLAAGGESFGWGKGSSPTTILADAASKAKIIAVQLPAIPYKDTSGTGLCVQILDAISYIAFHARGRRIVFNLSDGAYAGPHDGTSMLERAIDVAFSSSSSGGRHVLVVAAGNQFDEQIHWKSEIPANDSAEPIAWQILPDDNTDSHLEIWPASSTPRDALEKLQVSITPPGQPASPFVNWGDVWMIPDGASSSTNPRALAAVIFSKNPPNGCPLTTTWNIRGMVHVAVGATTPPRASARSGAPHGIWRVELKNTGGTPIAFDAYIERDNPALGDVGPRRQSHFLHPKYPRSNRMMSAPIDDTGNASPIQRMGALNNVATAAGGYVVGGYMIQTAQLAAYSAAGPGRSKGRSSGVDVLARCDSSQHIRGVRSTGVRTGTSFRMDGTSVATPVVTRWIANWMATNAPPANLTTDISAAATLITPPLAGSPDRIGIGRL